MLTINEQLFIEVNFSEISTKGEKTPKTDDVNEPYAMGNVYVFLINEEMALSKQC